MTTHRRLQTFARKYGEDTLALAYHAALPVALTPELLHLIRLNFLPELDYLAEANLLLHLCQEIGEGLYEIESTLRTELLQTFAESPDGANRLRAVAALLWRYSEQAHAWANYERLARAQQLTVLSMFEPHEALNWLAQAETLPSASDQRAWFIAMREELSSNAVNRNPTPKRNFIDSLLACPSMQDRTSRDWIVERLSFYTQIKRHTDYFFDVENIVNACMEHPNGLNELIETLQLFEADSIPMQAVLQFYDKLVNQQSASPEPSLLPKNYSEFIGREFELNEILFQLHPDKARAMVAIVGLGGMGKTALAQEVVDKAKTHFQHVVWISAKIEHFMSERTVTNGTNTFNLTELCAEIGRQCDRVDIAKMLPEQQRYATEYLLREQPTLIVLDSWDMIQPDRERLLQEFWPLLGQSKLLLTSRHQPLFRESYISLMLGGLPKADGLAFIQVEAKQRQVTAISQASQRTQLQIWEGTGGSPLAMKLVIEQAIYLSLDVVLNKLQQAMDNYEFYHFLFWDSWQLLDDKSKMVLADLSRFPPNTGGARPQIEQMSPLSPVDLWQTMKTLVLMSLVDKTGSITKERYALHPLTQYFIKSDITKEWQQT